MAALSLAQFGTEATDSLPRLEAAASSDVPRVQAAAAAAVASIKGNSAPRQLATAPSPQQLDDTSQPPANAGPGVAHLEEEHPALKRGPAENLLEVPGNAVSQQSPKPGVENTAKPNPSPTNSVVRPLRLQPSEHHHVPGQPSQKPRPQPPVLQLDAPESGAGKASSNP